MDVLRRSLVLTGVGMTLTTRALADPAVEQGARANKFSIAYNDDYAPYSYIEAGQVRGILPDILSWLLAPLAKLEVEHVGLPWRRVQLDVQHGKSDAFCTFASEERQQYTVFHKLPVVTLQPHLFFAADSPSRKTIEQVSRRADLMNLRLIDLKGNQWAEQNLKEFPKLEYAPGHDSVFRMIMMGRGDVHVSLSPVVTRWRIKKLGFSPEQIVSIAAPYIAAQVPFHLLVAKQHPRASDILKHVDDMLRRPGTARQIDDITARHT